MKRKRGRPIAGGDSSRLVPNEDGFLVKNYHITPVHNAKIKVLATYWNVSEAEVLRRLFDEHLQHYVDEAYKDAEEKWVAGVRRDTQL